MSIHKEPTRDELVHALMIMTFAYDAETVRDGLRYIGLGHWVSLPGMRFSGSEITTTDEAREVLVRHFQSVGDEMAVKRLNNEMDGSPIEEGGAA